MHSILPIYFIISYDQRREIFDIVDPNCYMYLKKILPFHVKTKYENSYQ